MFWVATMSRVENSSTLEIPKFFLRCLSGSITGVRLQPTVHLHFPITTVQNN